MRGFSTQAKLQTEAIRKSHRSAAPPKSHQHAPQRKPPDNTIYDTFAISKRFVEKRVMITPFCFCLLALGPLGTVRSLDKTPTFEPATPTGHPDHAKPALLLGNDPKSFCKFFPKFLRSPLCGLLRKIFQDCGIHPRLFNETSLKVSTFLRKIFECFCIPQRLVEETSFTASILPRRSGRSPLQYAAAFSPEMPFKGDEGCGYTQTNFV